MKEEIWRHRRPLERFRRALTSGAATVGFLGGSITEAAPGHNWPEKVMAWLAESYPHVRFTAENAAIGATGSDLGCFRAQRDILDRGCDLIFVEYAVNDYYGDKEVRKLSREGLLRQLLANREADIVLIHTYLQAMYIDMVGHRMPDSIAELESLAEHYGIGSVWVGLHAFQEVRCGRMDWDEWLPDGLHPTHRGSLSYAQAVIAFLEREFAAVAPKPECDESFGEAFAAGEASWGACLPQPLSPAHWGYVRQLPFAEVATEGPWIVKRSSRSVWMDLMLTTSAVGARLAFDFEGTGLALGLDYGKRSAGFRWRIDGSEPILYVGDRQDWWLDEGMFHLALLARDLPSGRHRAELEVVHGDGTSCTGTRFKLAFIGIIG